MFSRSSVGRQRCLLIVAAAVAILYFTLPQNGYADLTNGSVTEIHIDDLPADQWHTELARGGFNYSAERVTKVVPEERRHPKVQYTPSAGHPWQPIGDCQFFNDQCIFYPTGVFDPPLDVDVMKREAAALVKGETIGRSAGRGGSTTRTPSPSGCSTSQLDRWELFTWYQRSSRRVFLTPDPPNCSLPPEQPREYVVRWMAAALVAGHKYPLVVTRGDSMQANLIARVAHFMRGYTRSHDRGYGSVSYVMTNLRDFYLMPSWKRNHTRVQPSTLVKLAPGEEVLFEALYINSRGEGHDVGDGINATIPTEWPITALAVGTMMWDYHRRADQPEWKLSRTLEPARHVPFFEQMADMESRMPKGSVLFYQGGQMWNKGFRRFFRRMRLRNEAYRANMALARQLSTTRGDVAYIDTSYMVRRGLLFPASWDVKAYDGVGHFMCLLKQKITRSRRTGKITKRVLTGTGSGHYCTDHVNMGAFTYMTAYAHAVSYGALSTSMSAKPNESPSKESEGGGPTGSAFNTTANAWRLATTTFVEESNYVGENLCHGWAPKLQDLQRFAVRKSRSSDVVDFYGTVGICVARQTARRSQANNLSTSTHPPVTFGGGGNTTAATDIAYYCGPKVLEAFRGDYPDYCRQHGGGAISGLRSTSQLCPSTVTFNDIGCTPGRPSNDGGPTLSGCSAAMEPHVADAVFNRICHLGSETLKKHLLRFVPPNASDFLYPMVPYLRKGVRPVPQP